MEEMLNQLLRYTANFPNTTSEEASDLAAAITGDKPPKIADRHMSKTAYVIYDADMYKEMQAISDAAKDDPRILQRLANMLQAFSYTNERVMSFMISNYAKNLGAEKLFLETGLGPVYYLDWALTQSMKEQAGGIFEAVYAMYPNETAKYIQRSRQASHTLLTAFVCAKKGITPFGGALSNALSAMSNSIGNAFAESLCEAIARLFVAIDIESPIVRKRSDMLLEAAAESCKEAVAMLKAAISAVNDKPSITYEATRVVGIALVAGTSLPKANALISCAASIAPEAILPVWLWYLLDTNSSYYYSYWNVSKDINEASLGMLDQSIGSFGLSEEHIVCWIYAYSLKRLANYQEAAALYSSKAGLLAASAKAALPSLAVPLLSKSGAPLEEMEAASKNAIYYALENSEGSAEKLIQCLYGCSSEPYEYINSLPSEAIWAIMPIEQAQRSLLAMIMAEGAQDAYDKAVAFMASFMGYTSDKIVALFSELAPTAELSISHMKLAITLSMYDGTHKKAVSQLATPLSEHIIRAAKESKEAGFRLAAAEMLFESCPTANDGYLLSLLEDSSTKIRKLAFSFLSARKDLIGQIEPYRNSRKKPAREAAEKLLSSFELGASDSDADLYSRCQRIAATIKPSSFSWAFPNGMPELFWKEGKAPAGSETALALLAGVLNTQDMSISPIVREIVGALDQGSLYLIASEAYQAWLAQGAPAKRKSVILLYSLAANAEGILELRKQIEAWAERSRSSIAADAVKALAMGGSDLALMEVDTLSRKAKNKKVKNAALEAMQLAAASLGMSAEQLADRIVPNLGFSQTGEVNIDYGTRSFTAQLATDLSIRLFNEAGKEIKSLPKPGAKDSQDLASASRSSFMALKKSLKSVADSQKQRLEKALSTERHWSGLDWRKLFIENPIMQGFAISLIWGEYENGILKNSFRYMEEGDFTTCDEGSYELLDDAAIGLIHPVELDEETLNAWSSQLEDYEIVQPFAQLARSVYSPEESQSRKGKAVVFFGGVQLPAISLTGKLLAKGWQRGPLLDHGDYYSLRLEIGNLTAELLFTGYYAGYSDPTEAAVIGELGFFKTGPGGYECEYGIAQLSQLENTESLPVRAYSEAIYSISAAVAVTGDKEKAWSKLPGLTFA